MKKKDHYEIYWKNARQINFRWVRHYRYADYNNKYQDKHGFWHYTELNPPEPWYRKKYWGPDIVCLDNQWKYWPARGRSCRRLSTNQEIRENDFFDNYDEDRKEYKIKLRRRRSRHMIPTSWDDLNYSCPSVRSWKHIHKCKKQWMKNLE